MGFYRRMPNCIMLLLSLLTLRMGVKKVLRKVLNTHKVLNFILHTAILTPILTYTPNILGKRFVVLPNIGNFVKNI